MNKITLDTLSNYGSVRTVHLSRVFKKMTGLNISTYIATEKNLKAEEFLLGTDKKVTAIANECCFESIPYFHRTFKKYSGLTPSTYRKQRTLTHTNNQGNGTSYSLAFFP